MKRSLILTICTGVIAGGLLTGCISHDLNQAKIIDTGNKSIMVPPGGKGLDSSIKSMLREQGWDLAVRGKKQGMKITFGEGIKVTPYNNYETRYSLVRDSHWIIGDLYSYDISIVDNKTKKEVITLSGTGRKKTIVATLRNALSERNKSSM